MPGIKFDPNSSIILVRAKIKGRITQAIEMALDTGATYTMIPWEIAEALGYEPEISKRRINLTTASGVERVPLINVTSLEISRASVENIDIAVHDLPPTSRVDGLLGLNFLKNFEIYLNFKQGFLQLRD